VVDLTYEEQFERQICEYLTAHGWLYSPTGDGYDVERALFPNDVFGWFRDLDPEGPCVFRTAVLWLN